jgi:hypothetical protein
MESELNTLNFSENPEQKQMLDNELQSMDSIYVQLKKELKANPDDDRIINAMIEHYQTKVDVLSYVVDQLKKIRNENQNKKNDEKVVL